MSGGWNFARVNREWSWSNFNEQELFTNERAQDQTPLISRHQVLRGCVLLTQTSWPWWEHTLDKDTGRGMCPLIWDSLTYKDSSMSKHSILNTCFYLLRHCIPHGFWVTLKWNFCLYLSKIRQNPKLWSHWSNLVAISLISSAMN